MDNLNRVGFAWGASLKGRCTCRREGAAKELLMLGKLYTLAEEDFISSFVHLSFDGFHRKAPGLTGSKSYADFFFIIIIFSGSDLKPLTSFPESSKQLQRKYSYCSYYFLLPSDQCQ